MSWNYHFWARLWPNFNFVDFRAYFRHFSLVKSAKNKIAFLQQKECSNKKNEENKSGLEFNFLLKSECPSLNFEIWFFGANLTEPYWSREDNIPKNKRPSFLMYILTKAMNFSSERFIKLQATVFLWTHQIKETDSHY